MKVLKFQPKKELLNPSFEGYKLKSSSTSETSEVQNIPLLENALLNSCILDSSPQLQALAYKMSLNSLISNPYSPSQVYFFDENHGVWGLKLVDEELLEQILSPLNQDSCKKFPSMASISEDKILVIRGECLTIEIVSTDDEANSTSLNLPDILASTSFLRIEHASVIDGIVRVALCSYKASMDPAFTLYDCILKEQEFVVNNIFNSQTRPLIVHFESEGLVIGSAAQFVPTGEHVASNNSIKEPIIKWEQDEDFVHVTAPVANDENISVTFEKDLVIANCSRSSLIQDTPFMEINPQSSSWSISGSTLLLSIAKVKKVIWPLLWKDSTGYKGKEEFTPEDDLNSITLVKYSYKESDPSIIWKSTDANYNGPYLPLEEPSGDTLFVTVSYGDDTLVYSLMEDSLDHIATFDAFNFIQSGKQDRKYSILTDDCAIIVESSRHVYFYMRCKTKSSQSDQYLCTLDSYQSIYGWSITPDGYLLLLTKQSIFIIEIPKN